jgi:serine protease Do
MTRTRIAAAACFLGAAFLIATYGLDVQVDVRNQTAAARDHEGSFWIEGSLGPTSGPPPSFADLAEKLSPAVVNIQTERKSSSKMGSPEELFEEFFGRRRSPHPERRYRTDSTGSGFILSEDGYIVTNHHVIDGADRIVAALTSGKELEAQVIGTDAKTDLALIKVESKEPLPVSPLGDSDQIRVGDWVMAIGNPFGLDHTVTVGILSAKGRNINAGPYDDFLQTDASINPGNSGGPLIDSEGRVVGINSAINAAGQGIGFAIPINMAKELLPQLKATGIVTRGWLGVQIQRVTPELAETFGLESAQGALVSQVFEGSPAKGAKIERGDVIIEFNKMAIESYDDLPRRVAATPPGSRVPVTVIRDGKRKTLKATLEVMEQAEIRPASSTSPSSEWGFEVEAITDEAREALQLEKDARGVIVTNVDPESKAAEEGLRRGDVIVEANHRAIRSVEDLDKELSGDSDRILLLVLRGDGTLFVVVNRS